MKFESGDIITWNGYLYIIAYSQGDFFIRLSLVYDSYPVIERYSYYSRMRHVEVVTSMFRHEPSRLIKCYYLFRIFWSGAIWM